MYSHSIPTELDDFLNTISYPVEIVQYAFPRPDAVRDGELPDLFIPDKNKMVLARATIAEMIDYCDRVIQFKILHSYDIIEIFRYTTTYMNELANYTDIPEAANYLGKIRTFSGKLEHSVRILANKGNNDARQLVQSSELMNILKTSMGETPK